MTIEIQFTQADWDRIERDWTAWWMHELDRPMVMIEQFIPPSPDYPGYDYWEELIPYNFPLDTPVEEVIDHVTVQISSLRWYGDAWPRWWPNFGPGIIAAFLGAGVQAAPDTTWFEPARQCDISELDPQYEANSLWWQRVKAVTNEASARWADQVCVGFTDLGGNLDILASLHTTQQLLYDVMDAPDEVARLVGRVSRLWLSYYELLYEIVKPVDRGTTPWARIWSPGRTYMVQCDFSYMISPHMFERFVMPDLATCCEAMDHGFYHLDGKGQIPHLDMLLALESLAGIQWITGAGTPPPEEWLPLLKRIRERGKLCQLYVSPEGALQIVRELGGKGFALFIEQPMSAEEAADFLKVLTREDALH